MFYSKYYKFGFAANGGPVNEEILILLENVVQNYLFRSQSGNIIPNHDLIGGGSTNIVVNVDASGSSVEGDEEQGRRTWSSYISCSTI